MATKKREILYGPIQFSAIVFDDIDVIEGIVEELYLVREVGIIRLIDFIFVAKDEDGDVAVIDVSDFTDEERIKMGAVIGGLIGFGADDEEGMEVGAELGALAVAENDFGLLGDDVIEVFEDIPEGSSACFVLFEHTWAKGLKQVMEDHGGLLLAQGLIHPYAFVALGAELANAVNEEEAWEHEQMLQEKAETKKGTSTKKLEKESSKKPAAKKSKKKAAKK